MSAPTMFNGKPWDCADCGKPILADLVWGETAGAFHAACRAPKVSYCDWNCISGKSVIVVHHGTVVCDRSCRRSAA